MKDTSTMKIIATQTLKFHQECAELRRIDLDKQVALNGDILAFDAVLTSDQGVKGKCSMRSFPGLIFVVLCLKRIEEIPQVLIHTSSIGFVIRIPEESTQLMFAELFIDRSKHI